MSDIKTMLEESSRRITAVKAGQTYVDHVKHCQNMKAQLQEHNSKSDDVTMEVQRLSSHYLATKIATPGVTLGNVREDNSKTGDTGKKAVAASLIVGTTKFIAGCHISKKAARRLHSFLNKLECIHIIMVSLLHLKSRHLRTKLPLTFEVIKTLRKGSIPSTYDKRMSLIKGRSSRPLVSNDTMYSRIEMKQNSQHPRKESNASGIPSVRMDSSSQKDGSQISKPNLSTGGDSKTLSVSMQSKLLLFRRKTRNLLSALYDSPRVETWEDLMMAGTKMNRALKLLNPRRHPPWTPCLHDQKGTAGVLNRVHHPTGPRRSLTPKEEELPDSVLQKFKDEIMELKKNLRQNTLNSLAKLEREKLPKFYKVLSRFEELHPLWEQQVRVLGRISDEISFDPDIIMKDESITWYDALVQEGKNLANGQEIAEMAQLLSKLEALCRYDFSVIPQAKEKMCLLTMSLPAFEICAFHMQTALTFVLKEVLQLNGALLNQWLQIRGLPPCSGV